MQRELIDYVGDRPDQVGLLVARLAAVPLGVTAAGAVESATTWAAMEGNEVDVQVTPRELLIPEPLACVLPGALTHLVRNAIAHGIESPQHESPPESRARARFVSSPRSRPAACASRWRTTDVA